MPEIKDAPALNPMPEPVESYRISIKWTGEDIWRDEGLTTFSGVSHFRNRMHDSESQALEILTENGSMFFHRIDVKGVRFIKKA